ncbi:ribosome quality control complex subunit NEMF-like [Paramacrobiotus metropolitanus]|uniref:ribosome quality control complex subunit NEMF-like n=1 Tax=Paramacrobiotus metropolitanus TaxID=2943436 RepID=UPI002445D07F|nr:ribosome quality control complex subunit NEMF-like [Paramacrobiotus metropolitanus]
MKARFTNIDIVAAVRELQGLIGLRVTNVYDVDHKVYLFKFAKPDSKVMLLVESGIRIHTTDFEWPKNSAPSSFAMKLRKHIRNRRLERIHQLGVDRIVDMQFGSREAAYHVIVELYDRGNIVLTDNSYNILNILRSRTDEDTDVRFAVHEQYPTQMAKQWTPPPSEKEIRGWFVNLSGKDQLKKILNIHLFYGSALVEHALLITGLVPNQKVAKDANLEALIPKVIDALQVSENLYKQCSESVGKGYITYRTEKKIQAGKDEECEVYDEFHPVYFQQLKSVRSLEKDTFLTAVDEFYSKLESQKLDMNILEQQKLALKKLENVQRDHERRLDALRQTQEKEALQARLIEEHVELVDKIIVYMRTIMAAELSWPDVAELLERRRERGDEIAERVVKADIARNTVTIVLDNRNNRSDEDSDTEEQDDVVKLDINLGQSAFQNITRLHSVKKQAAAKEHKTIEASEIALKNAEKRTRQALKEVATIGTITKARKTYWFEKFFWFITSDNYLVIGGRDAQQNEILVKRYLKTNDFYVHADLHGASSVVVKNPLNTPPPPKALEEAGVMAISYSSAWEAKVPCRAWWVYSHQVTKTAPTGEYLTTGSFMIRGRKNFFVDLPMVMGFGITFKIDDASVQNHIGQEDRAETEADAEVTTNPGEDVALEMDNSSDDEAEVATVEQESGDINLLRSLASRILSTGVDNEENTLITATLSGFVPAQKSGSQKASVKQSGELKVVPPKINITKADVKEKNKPNAVEDDHDWSDYKKKKGKSAPRATKNYTQRHQGLPEKVRKKKTDRGLKTEESIASLDDSVKLTEEETSQNVMNEIETAGAMGDDALVEQPTETTSDQSLSERKPGTEERDEEDVDEDEPVTAATEDSHFWKTFIGNPLPNDILLFCLPVCAPYAAMQSFKYKMKLLPGTAKRGKAAKACFQAFIRDKTATSTEKDILKSIKDQDLSRNFPGSVKVALQQPKFKQRRK